MISRDPKDMRGGALIIMGYFITLTNKHYAQTRTVTRTQIHQLGVEMI